MLNKHFKNVLSKLICLLKTKIDVSYRQVERDMFNENLYRKGDLLMKMSKLQNNGYSGEFAEKCLGDNNVRLLKGAGATKQPEYKNGQPTGEIGSTRLEIYIENVGADKVKLPADFDLDESIKDFSLIELVNVEAIQVKNNIYFRADDIKPTK